ncbi:hypothetical protein AB5N19_07886 [Seiridium cardinale]
MYWMHPGKANSGDKAWPEGVDAFPRSASWDTMASDLDNLCLRIWTPAVYVTDVATLVAHKSTSFATSAQCSPGSPVNLLTRPSSNISVMAFMWIILSTQWSFSSVQASLNVIISGLGTTGLWAFTRFWWQRGSISVLRDEKDVPLSKIFTISSLGEVWDTVAVLRRQLFSMKHWNLLAQLVTVAGISLTCAFAGPIAQSSLRVGTTVLKKELQVFNSVKGGGPLGNLLYADVLWNTTAQNLQHAGFPLNQLLEFLPPSEVSTWTYVPDEWDPTWTLDCNFTEQTMVQNMTGSGKGNMDDPISAFPSYKQTHDQAWLDSSEYRVTSGFNSWANWSQVNQFQEVLFYILIQSDPQVNNRTLYNNETLRLSLSVLHARNFRVLHDQDLSGVGGEETWFPIGPVETASYSRVECVMTRKAHVVDEDRIPWPWTNDTNSIMTSYRTYYNSPFAAVAAKKGTVTPPTPEDLLRFYQVYMASVNTFQSYPSPRILSVELQTVELSLVFLVAFLTLSGLTAWTSIRYAFFLRRHKETLERIYVPDGKIEWMIHAAKSSDVGIDLEVAAGRDVREDSDHFCNATFGPFQPDVSPSNTQLQIPRFARVKTCRGSTCDMLPPGRSFVSAGRSTSSYTSSNEKQGEVVHIEAGKIISDDLDIVPSLLRSRGSQPPSHGSTTQKSPSITSTDDSFSLFSGKHAYDQETQVTCPLDDSVSDSQKLSRPEAEPSETEASCAGSMPSTC